MKPNTYIFINLAHFFLAQEMFQTKFMEKIRTHFVFSNLLFFENLTFYGIMWKHAVEQCFPTAGTRPGTGPWHQLYGPREVNIL
jgi:hypothetical protein